MKVKTTTIKATSRASVKVRDNYFTVEYSEERAVEYAGDEDDEEKLNEARQNLWDTCNNEIDNQIEDIKKYCK